MGVNNILQRGVEYRRIQGQLICGYITMKYFTVRITLYHEFQKAHKIRIICKQKKNNKKWLIILMMMINWSIGNIKVKWDDVTMS